MSMAIFAPRKRNASIPARKEISPIRERSKITMRANVAAIAKLNAFSRFTATKTPTAVMTTSIRTEIIWIRSAPFVNQR